MVAQQNDLSHMFWHLATAFNFLAIQHFLLNIKSSGTKKRNTRIIPFFSFLATLCIFFFSGSIRLALPVWKESAYPQEDQRQVTVRVKLVDDIDYA
ncbi:hypothetical protein FOXG_00914 [Fusarium oxysporum f. sp. lycopersici 4287]|uniref:Uncharacterized protein n=1 Tax=Fusarium oxysporum f. sp. lycopersici (strain 4287 / CBS 123668 / FGSC 9935 / NRRL 34936) TaxID=426428 RepID=A0A0J9UB20_FUSO4|nr:hypothetical protein FOXG_00914 [Fusarium oxysporum f. sp. lycopersici 4287]KNA95270.1 hypothetical protein FOXG_00914 [Fusarium oxysporum f. sp. lycopersici 4287]